MQICFLLMEAVAIGKLEALVGLKIWHVKSGRTSPGTFSNKSPSNQRVFLLGTSSTARPTSSALITVRAVPDGPCRC